MGKLPPSKDGCEAKEEELATDEDRLENIGRSRRVKHDSMVSRPTVNLLAQVAQRPE